MLVGMPASMLEGLAPDPNFPLMCALGDSGDAAVMSPCHSHGTKFLASDFGLAQPWP